MVGNHRILVIRRRTSHGYKSIPTSSDSWNPGANDVHNREDLLLLFDGTKVIFWCDSFQTVANIPGGRYLDTIAPGSFQLEWDVEPRQHRGKVHGIVFATDLDGQQIDGRSIEPVAGKNGAPVDINRWLLHDDQKLTTSPEGRTRVAWSAGCLVSGQPEVTQLWITGVSAGFMKGDRIPGQIIEADF